MAVDSVSVPPSGDEFTTESPAASEMTLILTIVPTGILRASRVRGIGDAVLMLMSARLLAPVGFRGTAIPFTVTIRRDGTLVGSGTA